MVQLTHNIPQHSSGDPDYQAWLSQVLSHFSPKDAKLLSEAAEMADAVGHIALCHKGIAMAGILVNLSAGPEAIAAAILYPVVEQQDLSMELVRDWNFSIALIIDGALNMKAVQALRKPKKGIAQQQQVDRLRKMLLSMVNDVRVALVKLAERTFAISQAKYLTSAAQKVMAYEVMNVYAPLANRLGIGQLKWSLEDMAFRYINPVAYYEIRDALKSKRAEREQYIHERIQELRQALVSERITGDVQGRVKHIYSIWRKMQKKHLQFNQLFDVRAMRVLVDDVPGCYRTLSCVQDLWETIPSEFDDYIATPKANGYRSIHTVVLGPGDKTIEVQIRTRDMHQESEMGLAAHWRYKEGVTRDASFETRIEWLRELLSWQQELGEGNQQVETLRNEVVSGQIYVFTPANLVIALPHGATPIDFAYYIHTDVGHRCRGARVDGKLVPLETPLQTGQRIEIITGKESRPSRDWITTDAHYVKTTRARQKVQAWFRQLNKAENIQAGKEQLHKALRQGGARQHSLEEAAEAFNFHQGEDLLVAIATGEVRLQQVIAYIQNDSVEEAQAQEAEQDDIVLSNQRATKPSDLVIDGVDNLLFHMGGCCHPVPGDHVLGYITQGRGVTVHRSNCQVLMGLQAKAPDRIVEVSWGDSLKAFEAKIQILASTKEVTRELTKLLAAEHIALVGLQQVTDKQNQFVTVSCSVLLQSRDQLDKLLHQVAQLPNVIKAER